MELKSSLKGREQQCVQRNEGSKVQRIEVFRVISRFLFACDSNNRNNYSESFSVEQFYARAWRLGGGGIGTQIAYGSPHLPHAFQGDALLKGGEGIFAA